MGRAILVDVTKCTGCGTCVSACQDANEQEFHDAPRAFDAETFTFVSKVSEDLYVRRLCMHCEDPTCASVCPVAALRKTPEGPVTYDADRCMGCRYCLAACPFGVPSYEWRSRTPRVRKCQMCSQRPEGPACAAECPQNATITGPREEMLAEARKRIAEDPKKYFPQIYGLTEAGGTAVLYIGPKAPGALGLPTRVEARPLPELTWRALKHVPDVVTFGSVLLGGLYWFTRRKEAVAEAEGHAEGDHTRKEDDHAAR